MHYRTDPKSILEAAGARQGITQNVASLNKTHSFLFLLKIVYSLI